MKHTLTFLVALLLATLGTLQAADSPKSNIVILYADDLGYGDVQCYNPERGKIPTPHIDKLAAQGMRFTDGHSSSGVCSPSRYTLLTGRYHWRTGLQSGVLDGGNDEPLIAADRITVAGFLKQQGYSTACIGKWHLGFQSDTDPKKIKEGSGLPVRARIISGPTTRGFDLYFGCSNARTMSSLIENDRVIEHVETIDMLPRLGTRAVSHLAACAKSDAPFFLYLPLTSPHTPIVPTAAWKGKSGLGDYADFVMQTDAIVGEVLAALDQHGLAENTMVIFTADNGCAPYIGVGDLEKRGHYPSGPMRGYKADAWEGGHRVPFIVRWPGKVKPGSTCDQLVQQADLIATFAEVFETQLPDHVGEDSFSLLPLLQGNDGPVRKTAVNCSISGVPSVRQGQWKYIAAPGSGGWGKGGDQSQPVQLYNLANDIAETKNLAAAMPEKVAEMKALLEKLITDGRSTPGAKQPNDVEVRRHPARAAAKAKVKSKAVK